MDSPVADSFPKARGKPLRHRVALCVVKATYIEALPTKSLCLCERDLWHVKAE